MWIQRPFQWALDQVCTCSSCWDRLLIALHRGETWQDMMGTSSPKWYVYKKNFRHTAKCSSLKGHRTTMCNTITDTQWGARPLSDTFFRHNTSGMHVTKDVSDWLGKGVRGARSDIYTGASFGESLCNAMATARGLHGCDRGWVRTCIIKNKASPLQLLSRRRGRF